MILGGSELLAGVPRSLSERQAVIISKEAIAAGPDAESEEWAAAVAAIEDAAKRVPAPATKFAAPQPLPAFSSAALAALTDAMMMAPLDGSDDPARLRTAALLGALRTSAVRNMTPTTGDVVRLVLERQADGRGPEETFAAAAAAAGLTPLSKRPMSASDRDELARTTVGELVLEAAELQRRTGSDSVHLRHVLALGVHPAVPAAALEELGVTLAEIRSAWRASIARTWPDESRTGWDAILRDRGTSPPSARVHADRWTTEDRLDYALYARAIAEFIRHEDAEPPMVISVQAPWGQGKTSLMRMVQRDLDPGHPDLSSQRHKAARREDEPPSALTYGELHGSLDGTVKFPDPKPQSIRTVWFNAWKYQSSEQIWAGLAHSILSQLPARLSAKDRERFWLRLQLRRIDPSAVRKDIHRAILERFLPLLVFGSALIAIAGLSLLAGGLDVAPGEVAGTGALSAGAFSAAAWLTARKKVLTRPLEGAYLRYVQQPDYEGKLGYLHLVEHDMALALDLLTPDDEPAVIFIDDLDRCSPAKIGEVIEAVNLFLAGEYPNCAFVIGIDAEPVAASMEVVHAEIIKKLGDRRGELGWRFMDKFVQLPFVLPRLHPDQREAYLRGLFTTPDDQGAGALVAEAERLEADVRDEAEPVDDLARRVGELAPRLAAVAPDRARSLGEQVVSAGARAFSDSDPEVIQALADQIRHLSDNPRTIKRAVNLYRFHRFTAFARQASTLPLAVATPEQIGRWIIVIIRWPHFVRWLQTQRDEGAAEGDDPAAQVLGIAGSAADARAFTAALRDAGLDASASGTVPRKTTWRPASGVRGRESGPAFAADSRLRSRRFHEDDGGPVRCSLVACPDARFQTRSRRRRFAAAAAKAARPHATRTASAGPGDSSPSVPPRTPPGAPASGRKRPTSGTAWKTAGSRAAATMTSPTTVTIWLRTSAPTQTPRGPSRAATARLRHRTSAMPPAPSVASPRPARTSSPTMMVGTVTRIESATPATEYDIALAASSRRRFGAASTEPVIVRWRHSPVIAIAPSRTMM